jgi:hypothetical protein
VRATFRSTRYSSSELAREAVTRGIVAESSGTTVWRWLSEDAIRPWNYRSWIFPRDPRFAEKAGRVLDLYEGRWEGELLHPVRWSSAVTRSRRSRPAAAATQRFPRPLVAGCGSSTSTSAEGRCATSLDGTSGARIFDRCAPKDGIVPFDQLIEQFMSVEPYRAAPRVFVIVDNGSAHRGKRSIDRLQGAWPNLVLVHTPVHASWLNQAEIYFSVVQRKVLSPNDFSDLDVLEQRLRAFARRYEQIAQPFNWKFTRHDLHELLARADKHQPAQLAA